MKLYKALLNTLVLLSFFHQSKAQTFDNECVYSAKQTSFSVIAKPTSAHTKVVLRLYDEGINGTPIKTVKMTKQSGDTWTAIVKGNLKGKFYTFDISGNSKDRLETPGVFAKAVGVNGLRGAIVDMNDTNPIDWNNDNRPKIASPTDLVIYEMHNRDYSVSPNSGIKNKGKFLALTEPKAIKHLKDLGINAVHLLPSFDYASVDETRLDTPQFNWGYDPLNYNVPEGSYSTNPYDPTCRIKEFKQMVQALHKAGIRVILDVVYNHVNDISASAFQRTMPDYFFRKTSDGKYSDGSGCNNETASEKPLMREFMIKSALYWINEYHIDGLRFDLMGIHDIETMNQIRAEVNKIDPSLFIYGEGWSAGTCAYPVDKLAMKANTKQLNGIAAFSDDMRDALRGPFSDDKKGAFLAGISGEEESLKFGIVGAISHPQVDMSKVNYSKKAWANDPIQQISYVSCHDDMCLVDRLHASIPDASIQEIIKLDLLAQTAVFTSQGVPFMLSGEEMLRSKQGVHNSFKSPDSINQLNWDNLEIYPYVFNYYKKLIQLRKNHPAFRLGTAEAVKKHLSFLPTQPCLVGFVLSDNAGGDSWNRIIVLLNGSKEKKTVTIPKDNYTIVCSKGEIVEEGCGTIQGDEVTVEPRSSLIIHN